MPKSVTVDAVSEINHPTITPSRPSEEELRPPPPPKLPPKALRLQHQPEVRQRLPVPNLSQENARAMPTALQDAVDSTPEGALVPSSLKLVTEDAVSVTNPPTIPLPRNYSVPRLVEMPPQLVEITVPLAVLVNNSSPAHARAMLIVLQGAVDSNLANALEQWLLKKETADVASVIKPPTITPSKLFVATR